ncbi:MAG TPA: lysylphosphatidylglycerol synthase transmembrane domain-containing protein [Candidatus Edwardsbacteria bacterium]|nr:lysylphosphatidylglycerol synthase transmembrane domain-containing protein [Candidatus Edwardsbacteria bacterium]
MKQAIKKTVTLLLRIAISLALIAWILYKVDRRQLMGTIRAIDPWLALLAVAAYVVVNGLCAWRWQVLLRARGVETGFWPLQRYFLNGLFFGNFLPTTVGGDLMRAYLVADQCSKRSDALASVLVDRVIGLFGVILTGVAGLILVARTGQELALLKAMAVSITAALLLVALFLNKALVRKFRWMLRVPLIERIEQQLVDFYHSIYVYRTHPLAVVWAFLQSLLIQLMVVVTAYCIALSMHLGISIRPFVLYMPVIGAVSMVPVSINGWGLQEGAFIVFFGRAGLSRPEALSLGFLYHLVAVAISLAGGLLWLFYGGRRKPSPDEPCPDPNP